MSSGDLEWPNKCITVNLAPSGTRKTGAGLDLAIAVGVLIADEQLRPGVVDGLGFVGELGLDGTLRRVPGVAPMVAVLGGRRRRRARWRRPPRPTSPPGAACAWRRRWPRSSPR